MRIGGFDWDEGNRAKCEKHGVYRDEIEEVFLLDRVVVKDAGRQAPETRFIGVGQTGEGKFIFVVFTLRSLDGRLLIRPISARYMHRKEIESYEEAISGLPD